jgi:hypothetical protein
VAKHDGLTFAPVLVEDLNTVFGCNRAHVTPSLASVVVRTRLSKSTAVN